jgi:hypothetical protein
VGGDLRIVPLSSHLLELDLAAYRAGTQAIRAHSAGRWPPDLGLDEARRLMSVHESEHQDAAAYAYAILDQEGERELGCVYLRPLGEYLGRTGTHVHDSRIDPERAAIVTFWLIDDTDLRPATASILRCIRQWVTRWGAAHPVYRCLPAEVSTLAALEAARDLRPIAMTGQELPYLWFVDEQTGSTDLSS